MVPTARFCILCGRNKSQEFSGFSSSQILIFSFSMIPFILSILFQFGPDLWEKSAKLVATGAPVLDCQPIVTLCPLSTDYDCGWEGFWLLLKPTKDWNLKFCCNYFFVKSCFDIWFTIQIFLTTYVKIFLNRLQHLKLNDDLFWGC